MGYAHTYPDDNSSLLKGLTDDQATLARTILADDSGADLSDLIDAADAPVADKLAIRKAISGNP